MEEQATRRGCLHQAPPRAPMLVHMRNTNVPPGFGVLQLQLAFINLLF